jgi:hypothetical protein
VPSPEPKSSHCWHEHLKFEEGTFKIACLDCDQFWVARYPGTSETLYTGLRNVHPQFGRDTRHDRFAFPKLKRDEKSSPKKG